MTGEILPYRYAAVNGIPLPFVGKLAPAEHDLLHLFRLLEPTDQQRLLGHAKVYLGVDVPAPSKRARKQHSSD